MRVLTQQTPVPIVRLHPQLFDAVINGTLAAAFMSAPTAAQTASVELLPTALYSAFPSSFFRKVCCV